MIAGGSGITPIWSTLKAIADEYSVSSTSGHHKPVEVWLIYGNRKEKDILIREELDQLSRHMKGSLNIWHVLSSNELSEGWALGRGHVDLECLQYHLPPAPSYLDGTGHEDTLALVCGPPAMEVAVSTGLQKLGWNVEKSIVFF